MSDKENNGKKNIFDKLDNSEDDIEINDENFLEIVESNLSLINNNYIKWNKSDKVDPKINKKNKIFKGNKGKKKKKYNRRFKILKYCLNQLAFLKL